MPAAPPVGPPPFGGGHPGPVPGDAPIGGASGGPEQTSRRKLPVRSALIALCAAVAVGGGAWVAWDFFQRGGASSPEEAATTLVEAINGSDIAGVLSILNPEEVHLAADFYNEASDAVERAQSSETKALGVTFEVSDLELDVDEVADGIAVIRVDRANATVRPDDDGGSGYLAGEIEDAERVWSEADMERYLQADLEVVAVKEQGGWYLSPTLTFATWIAAIDEVDPDWDEYSSSREVSEAADSPEAAIELLAEAVEDGDREMIGASIPSSQGALAFVFDEWFEHNEEYYGEGWTIFREGGYTLKDFDVEVEDGPSGTKRLIIDSAEGTFVESTDALYDGWTREWSIDGYKFCSDDSSCEEPSLRINDLDYRMKDFFDGGYSLIARKVDGGWKIDPMSTLIDYGIRFASSLSGDMTTAMLRLDNPDGAQQLQLGVNDAVEMNEANYAVVELRDLGDDPVAFGIGPANLDVVSVFAGEERFGVGGVTVIAPDEGVIRLGVVGEDSAPLDVGLIGTVDGTIGAEILVTMSSPMTRVAIELAADTTFSVESSSSGDDLVAHTMAEYGGHLSWEDSIALASDGATSESTVFTRSRPAELYVTGRSGSSVALRITEAVSAFADGSASTSLFVSSYNDDSVDVELVGPAMIRIDGLPYSAEAYLYTNGGQRVDTAYSGGAGPTFLEASSEGNYSVEISTWGSPASVVLTLEDL